METGKLGGGEISLGLLVRECEVEARRQPNQWVHNRLSPHPRCHRDSSSQEYQRREDCWRLLHPLIYKLTGRSDSLYSPEWSPRCRSLWVALQRQGQHAKVEHEYSSKWTEAIKSYFRSVLQFPSWWGWATDPQRQHQADSRDRILAWMKWRWAYSLILHSPLKVLELS